MQGTFHFQKKDFVIPFCRHFQLKVAAKRDDKIFLLKMKGSLHFLLEEKKRALETWKHVLRLNPKDEEVAQMISSWKSFVPPLHLSG